MISQLLSNWPEEGVSFDQKRAALRFFVRGLRAVKYKQNIEEPLLSVDALFQESVSAEIDLHLLKTNVTGKFESRAVSTLATIDVATYYSVELSRVPLLMQSAVFISLFSHNNSPRDSVTIMEAAGNIRRLITSSRLMISEVPDGLDLLETLEYVVHLNIKRNAVSFVFFKLVKQGWSVFTQLKSDVRADIIPPRRKRHHKPQIQTQPIPFSGNELTIEEPEESQHIELDESSVFPVRAAQRDLFRNKIIETREQFGLLLCPVRLSSLEVQGVRKWLSSASGSISSVLASLVMLTALKEHEILGLHVTNLTTEVEPLMSDGAVYGVVDLQAHVYWRRELDVQNRFSPSEENLPWLNNHQQWLALPIPELFIGIISGVVLHSDQCTVETWLDLSNEKQAKEFLNHACREIREIGQLQRPISRRELRYWLFACVADRFGQHVASLIFANNSFSNSTRHYYMAASAEDLQRLFVQAINPFTPVDMSSARDVDQAGMVGSRLSISVARFKQRLASKVSALNELLLTVKTEKDLEQLRYIYNLIAAYTVTMFACATSHRRHNSIFIEHSCWNYDYSQVLVADKIFFGESAVRIIPVPEMLSSQIRNSKGWVEQIIKRLIAIRHPFSEILIASLSRRGNTPFLGVWVGENTLTTAGTSQISMCLGDDWTLPQNCMRQLSYQAMFQQPQSSQYLDHQMGHVSSALNSFQNTSLRSLHDDEKNSHRDFIGNSLNELGFVNLRRTKFSGIAKLDATYFLPETINGNDTITTKQLATTALTSVMAEVKATNKSVYELLDEKLADQPFIHEEALKQLEALMIDENGNQLDDETFERLLKGVYFKSPKVETVFPYRMHMAEHSHQILYAQFIELVAALFNQYEGLDNDYLKSILLISLIFDGENTVADFLKIKTEKSLIIENISYKNHYLTGDIEKKPIIFSGISSVLLILLLNKSDSRSVKFNIAQLDKCLILLTGRKRQSIAGNLLNLMRDFVNVALRELQANTWSLVGLLKHISINPRPGETGVLFGLRQGTVKTKHLSFHALMRLISPIQFFTLNSTQELASVQERALEKRSYKTTKDKSFYKAFFKELPQALDEADNNAKMGIRSYWNHLIKDGKSRSSVSELVNDSNSLPEIIVLILSWLLEAASRHGQRDTGLQISTIKTYLSTIGPALCELCSNTSLLSLDYDDLIDVYQGVIDMGEPTHTQSRSKRLMDFHKQCRRYFPFPKVDWQDLDVPLVDEAITRNIITHVEYERAFNLLENDQYLTPSEQESCLAVLIISYRLMTRRGETRRLRVNDWCVQSGLCSVRSNVFGSTKTVKGNRRIPYTVLMTTDEQERIHGFIEKAKTQNGNSPLFCDSLFPNRIRSMDKTFNRVTEALQLATGDKSTRLYDCRHTGINFISTALQLSDSQTDPIALSIKRWLPCGTFAEFQESFRQATIGNPSTRHALLPALAMMVGHSSATTTISNYIHLTHYWRWLAIERELRSLKTLDSGLQALVKMPKAQFFRQKNKTGLSAAYCILEDLITKGATANLISEEGSHFPELELSDIAQDTLTARLVSIKDIERSLRVLEYLNVTSGSNGIDLNGEQAQYVIEKSDLETSFVSRVWQAYQDTLEKDVGYRAFSIPARLNNVVLPDAYRPKAAEAYLSDPDFWGPIKVLLSLDQTTLNRFLSLWGHAWDASDRVCKVPENKRAEWQAILGRLSWYPEFKPQSEVRRHQHGILVKCHELRLLSKNREEEGVSMLKLSHALFLMTLQQKLALS
ncbi:hypothetical protein GCM10009112_23740 [Marinomonas arenicola]|uniref:hypothetical protein n=1 Tax=Marinomonas TaxID=28253 RepID=UPI001055275B|nr:hypothetical protein [Marinomonas sp. KMM3893]